MLGRVNGARSVSVSGPVWVRILPVGMNKFGHPETNSRGGQRLALRFNLSAGCRGRSGTR
eukprot:130267-Pyramimonas_sp.AAC.2